LKTENIEGEMEQTGKNIEKQLCIKQEIELLEAVFPGTNLKLFFKTATAEPARGQEF